MESLPTFLVIGAARSGTTSLFAYLRQHPEIFVSEPKESNFFAYQDKLLECKGPGADYINNSVTTLDEYKKLFKGSDSFKAVGEVCPLYLYEPDAPENIHKLIPNAKLIAILRNPLEQAFSHFLYAKRQALEPLDDFAKALEQESDRIKKGWQPVFAYSQFPQYASQLKRFYALFPRDQIRIYLYEDYERDPAAILRNICQFIGADENFAIDTTTRLNAGGVPKSSLIQDLVMKPYLVTRLVGMFLPERFKEWVREVVSDNNLSRPEFPEKARERLKASLEPDIRELQSLIGRDLSAWLD